MDEDEDSGFNLGRVVQAAENFPAGGSSRRSPALRGVGSGVAMHVEFSPWFWALHPFHGCSGSGPFCHIFLAVTKLHPGAL